LDFVLKGQLAQRVSRNLSKKLEFLLQHQSEEKGKYFKMKDRVFERKCNIYLFDDIELIPCRYKRHFFKKQFDKTFPGPAGRER